MKTYDPIYLSEAQYFDMNENYGGFCIECRETAHPVEPDARHYPCESCGVHAVFGVEELLIRGMICFEGFPSST